MRPMAGASISGPLWATCPAHSGSSAICRSICRRSRRAISSCRFTGDVIIVMTPSPTSTAQVSSRSINSSAMARMRA
ncbi:hypothetical protein ACIF70_10375 [Actinacidiphila glaucinigra]|uniref:hypothetical protein n=1 Tax=Actinacidiphila glaucinigra TaxID=235986 RepID=UPI0037CA1D3E